MSQAKREELYKKLTADFPKEAYSADRTRESITLTSLKAQYVVERLNEVIGIGNWALHGTWKDVDDGILYIGSLEYSIPDTDGKMTTHATGDVPGFAGTDKESSGDAYKSARTDCLSKAASYLGIGNEMYKGNVAPPERAKDDKEEESEEEETKDTPRSRFRTTSRKVKASEDNQETSEETSEEDDQAETEEEAEAPKQPKALKPSRMFNRSKLTNKFKSNAKEQEA